MTVTEEGFRPAIGTDYDALWTRDHAYCVWHDFTRTTPEKVRQFITHRLAKRSTGVNERGDGYGTTFPDFIADRISGANNIYAIVWQNPGASAYPFMDGIAFIVLALWSDWNATGSTATYTANKTAIDACLAALPRSANGCVYSNPAGPSVDYGFTDSVLKTGDVTYGTALLAWAYRMLSEIAGENGVGTYSTAFAQTKTGLATLRKPSGWYMGSSVNNAAVDDVWATALIVAENLLDSGTDRLASARTIAEAYSWGTISSKGWVRHLPTGQFWVNTVSGAGSYQNGGYWLTPVWDCYRAVALVDPAAATGWANAALNTVADQIAAEGTIGASTAPYEWFNGATISTPKGYTASAALIRRFV